MILNKVKEIIAEQLNIGESEIKEDTSFEDDLGADSLDIFQIIMALEEEFELEISNEEAEKISTVQDVVEYIKNANDAE
jgi:acyl carrier protein